VQQSLKTMVRIRDVDPVDHSKHFAPQEEGVLYFERSFRRSEAMPLAVINLPPLLKE